MIKEGKSLFTLDIRGTGEQLFPWRQPEKGGELLPQSFCSFTVMLFANANTRVTQAFRSGGMLAGKAQECTRGLPYSMKRVISL
jgi:hypothetical protein